jgi:hypothetical protein
MRAAPVRGRRAGFTLNEALIATALLAIVLLGAFTMAQRDVQVQRSSLAIGVAEQRAQAMLFRLERELARARGEAPRTDQVGGLGSGSSGPLQVGATLAFPDRGLLLLDRAGARELVAYEGLAGNAFVGLERGLGCTADAAHGAGAEVLWAGLAEPLSEQQHPPAGSFDGRALEPTGPLFFRGLGAGFAYRVPVDEDGGSNVLEGSALRWGELVPTPDGPRPSREGRGVIRFEPVWVFDEAERGADLNEDGDRDDRFDVGQIRRRSWSAADPAAGGLEVGLGPTVVLQERCAWGSDLDGDGFEDPLFLWDAEARTLHVRLFVLGATSDGLPIVRRVESVLFLRNEPGEGA